MGRPVRQKKCHCRPIRRPFFSAACFSLLCWLYSTLAAEIVLPMVLAIILKLLLQPFVRVFDRLGVPRGIGAALAIAVLVTGIAGLVSAIAGPGASWAGKLPSAIPEVQQRLAFLQAPLATAQWVLQQIQGIISGGGGSAAVPPAPAARLNLLGALFSGTAAVATGLFTTLLVLFYLLVSGEIFLRRIVEILPTFGDKRQAVETSLHIERDVSVYLVTVTLINVTVGLCTLGIMWACGVANPLLWGVIALVLNYVPIIGPVVGMVIFLMASVLSLGVTWWALLPVGLYLLRACDRGRVRHAAAGGPPLHHQSGRRDPGADILVLDVGGAGRDPRRADAGHHQDRLRRPASVPRVRPSAGGLVGAGIARRGTSWEPRRLDGVYVGRS